MEEIIKLDALNRRLLYELNYDCRQSDSQMARKLKSSKQVINYRIKKLEELGVISAYNALIDFRVLGFSSLRVYIKLRNTSPEVEEEIADYIRDNDLFLWSVTFDGEMDLGFYIWVKNIDLFFDQWETFLSLFRKYIFKQELYFSKNMIHYPFKLFFKPEEVAIWNIQGSTSVVNIDELDLKILKSLSRNAKISLVELANKFETSANVINYRMKQLEKKKILLAYNAIIDEKKLGYLFYKVDFYLQSHDKLVEMYEFARQHKNIKNVMKTMGGPDFEIEVFVKGALELQLLIKEIKKEFSEEIDYYRYNRVSKTIKQVYLPINSG